MTDRLISEERIGRALRVQADEAIRPFDPSEITRLAAETGSSLRPWASRSGRTGSSIRWLALAAALLLLAAIAALVGAGLFRAPVALSGGPLFVAQVACEAGCERPTGIRASTVDPQTGKSIASWDLPFDSDTMSGPPVEPAWSPDRRHVLLYDWNNQLVAIVDVPNGTLVTPAGDDPIGITGYAWGPGSDRIARVSGGDSDGVNIVDLNLHQLARFEVSHGAMIYSRPAWSPDGSNLVVTGCLPCDTSFQGSPHTPHQDRLFVMPVDGSPIRAIPLASGMADSPAWSPDGTSIAVGTAQGIRTVRVSDGQERALTSEPGSEPRWSPDGSRLAFAATANGHILDGSIVVVELESGRRTTLTNGLDSHPQWSPDGTWLVFSRNSGGPYAELEAGDIMIVPITGGEPRLVAKGATAGW